MFSALAGSLPAILKRLGELGFVDGKNLSVELRSMDGVEDRALPLARELVQAKCDLIIAYGSGQAAKALIQATASIPIVIIAIDYDPLEAGIVRSLRRPGGNVTGLATLNPELFFAKQIELLHEIAPAFAEAARHKPELLYVSGDALFMAERATIAELALRHRLPAMFLFHERVESGGLMSYGIDIIGQFRQAAAYVDRILKGTPPRDLPIEELAKYVMAINLKTARALGIPRSAGLWT